MSILISRIMTLRDSSGARHFEALGEVAVEAASDRELAVAVVCGCAGRVAVEAEWRKRYSRLPKSLFEWVQKAYDQTVDGP